MNNPSFTLTEEFAFGSQYTWRLKEGELRFRGGGDFERLVRQRIPASEPQIASFFSALDLIQVWEWRKDYKPDDIGLTVMDGSSWKFTAESNGRYCQCGGVNAYPSYHDCRQTTTDRERFALLCAAMYDCFEIEAYIQQAP